MESNGKMIAIVVAVVAVLGIGGWAILGNKDDKKSDSNTNTSQSETTKTDQMKSEKNIVEVASADSNFSTLVTAVKAAGLVDTLSGEGPFTVFAPTNDAFNKLPAGTLDTLLKPENVDQLKSILTYHVVAAKAMSSDLSDGQELTTVQGAKLKIGISGGEVTLTDAKGNVSKVTKADIAASNGVIHVIDTVVMPQ